MGPGYPYQCIWKISHQVLENLTILEDFTMGHGGRYDTRTYHGNRKNLLWNLGNVTIGHNVSSGRIYRGSSRQLPYDQEDLGMSSGAP